MHYMFFEFANEESAERIDRSLLRKKKKKGWRGLGLLEQGLRKYPRTTWYMAGHHYAVRPVGSVARACRPSWPFLKSFMFSCVLLAEFFWLLLNFLYSYFVWHPYSTNFQIKFQGMKTLPLHSFRFPPMCSYLSFWDFIPKEGQWDTDCSYFLHLFLSPSHHAGWKASAIWLFSSWSF